MSKLNIIQVALPLPLPTEFDYFCEETARVGVRVLVPFGARKIIGVVCGLHNSTNFTYDKIKKIIKILDKKPLLNLEIFLFCQWVSKYYQAPIGEALSLAVPNTLRKNQQPKTLRVNYIWQTNCVSSTARAKLKNAKKQLKFWHFIDSFKFGIENSELNRNFQNWHSFANQLLNKNLVVRSERTIYHKPDNAKQLNQQQQIVIDNIVGKLDKFRSHLLYGITGSGKTEVFLQIISKIIEQNRQVLILVPEISLTPQTSQRFKQRFNINIETQHSKLNDSERYQIWANCKANKTKILIGTRSAIFNQFEDLGLIIVDEEHDLSFKQQDGVRYSARDLAVVRAKNNNIPIILASATPSLESIYNAKLGNYQLHKLLQRAGSAKLPKFKFVDISQEKAVISKHAIKAITEVLAQDLQAMVFINRRGFSPVLYCAECTATSECTNCQANLTIHKNPPKMICHHCGLTKNIASKCAKCASNNLIMLGAGTERIEQQLTNMFPDKKVVRIDKDTTKKKQAWYDLYQEINKKETGILVGTQMLAKGHHFPKVALVVIIGIDNALLSADFRATEHLTQLVTQVSGRSGREQYQGVAILQTRYPKHPLLQKLVTCGYLDLSQDLLSERKTSNLPPFTGMCVFHSQSLNADKAKKLLLQIKQTINNNKIEVLGPIPAPMEKIANKFRFQLILQANNKKQLQQFLSLWLPKIKTIRTVKGVKLKIDVDPLNMV